MMESLAFTHAALAYADPFPAPQLRSFQGISRAFTQSAISVLAFGVAISVITKAENAMAYLSYGASGSDVVYLQNLLKEAGYFPYNVPSTGRYLEITQQSVMNYQRDMGLAVDGIAGAATFATLEGVTAIGSGDYMVTASALNVRTGGSTSAAVVDVVYYQERVSVDYFDDYGWAKLSDGGWVSGNYLASL